MKTKNQIKYFILSLTLIVVPVFSAQALTISVQSPTQPLQIGKTSLIKIYLENRDQSKEINALEGKLKISHPDEVVSITTGGSIFNLWPVKPSLEKDTISFAGGTPSGVFGGSLNVFTIAVKPKTDKEWQFSFEGVSAYLNDGSGTKLAVSGTAIKIPVSKTGVKGDEYSTLISSDTLAPQGFNVDLGRDPALYDGKYFISFYASDNESGIKRYEVTESGYPTVRSGSVYVLQDQSLTGTVKVKAIDNAGNERVKTVKLQNGNPWSKFIIIIVIIAIIIAVGYVVVKIRRQKKS